MERLCAAACIGRYHVEVSCNAKNAYWTLRKSVLRNVFKFRNGWNCTDTGEVQRFVEDWKSSEPGCTTAGLIKRKETGKGLT